MLGYSIELNQSFGLVLYLGVVPDMVSIEDAAFAAFIFYGVGKEAYARKIPSRVLLRNLRQLADGIDIIAFS